MGLARTSCSTKEHIRAIDGSVTVEKASNLHAGPCRAEMAEIEVAQNALCSAAPPGLAESRQRIDGDRRSSWPIPEEPIFKAIIHLLRAGFSGAEGEFQIEELSLEHLMYYDR